MILVKPDRLLMVIEVDIKFLVVFFFILFKASFMTFSEMKKQVPQKKKIISRYLLVPLENLKCSFFLHFGPDIYLVCVVCIPEPP